MGMTDTEDTWSRDSDGAEEAARRLWEASYGPAWGDLREVDFDDEDFFPYRPNVSNEWDAP